MKSLLTNSLPIKKIISINIQKWFFGKGKNHTRFLLDEPWENARRRSRGRSRRVKEEKEKASMIFSLSKKTIFGWEANERKKVRFKKWFFGKWKKSYPLSPRRTLRDHSAGEAKEWSRRVQEEKEKAGMIFSPLQKPFLHGTNERKKVRLYLNPKLYSEVFHLVLKLHFWMLRELLIFVYYVGAQPKQI